MIGWLVVGAPTLQSVRMLRKVFWPPQAKIFEDFSFLMEFNQFFQQSGIDPNHLIKMF